MKPRLFLYLLFIAISSWGQVPSMVNFGAEQGLTAANCYIISQDRDGFIWIGSDNGAYRFDGTEFIQFANQDQLSNLEILRCLPLKDGSVYLLPAVEGVAFVKNGKVFNSKNFPELGKLDFNNNMYEVCYDAPHEVVYFYARFNPKKVYAVANGKVKTYPVRINSKIKYKTEDLICMGFDLPSKTLFYTAKDTNLTFSYNLINQKTEFFNAPMLHNARSFLNYEGYIIANKTSSNNSQTLVFKTLPKIPQLVDQIKIKNYYYTVVDNAHCIWNCEAGGGVTYHGKIGQKHEPVTFLTDYLINHVFRDRDGNLWFSTQGSGVFFMPKKYFEYYLKNSFRCTDYVWKISQGNGPVALGLNNSEMAWLTPQKNIKQTITHAQKQDCRGLFVNQDKYLFANASNLYLGSTNVAKRSQNKLVSVIDGCKNIIALDDHNILACTHVGLYRFNLMSEKPEKLFDQRCYAAAPIAQDHYFVATYANLYTVNKKQNSTRLISKNCFANDIVKINTNEFAAGTSNSGILILNEQGIKRHLGKAQGLPNNRITKLTVERPNCYWASSPSGLIRIEETSAQTNIRTFTQLDGLPADQVNDCKIFRDSIFVATSKGLGVYALKDLLSPRSIKQAKVMVNWVSTAKTILHDPKTKITLQYPDNYLKINLSYPDFSSAGKITYRYFIEGLSQKWEATNANTLVLNKLSPGNYVLKIYGVGLQSQSSAQPTVLPFEIKPAFWQTWWFMVLIILALSALLFLAAERFYQKRRKQKLAQLVFEKKVAELELQAIKAQINPHFIYNCLNSMKYLLYVKEYEQTDKYLDAFSKMIRHTLNYSDKTFITIEEEMAYLSLYLSMENLRFRNNFSYEIKCHPSVNITRKIPSLLVQPFVENALKHGVTNLENRHGHVDVVFDQNPQELIITVTDNGDGITQTDNPMSKSESFGIKLSQKRVETFKMLFESQITLEIINQSATGRLGTQVIIRIKTPANEH